MAVYDVSEAFKTEAKISGVESDTSKTLFSLAWSKFSLDDLQGSKNLHQDTGSWGLSKQRSGIRSP